jgi:hypothetical protein
MQLSGSGTQASMMPVRILSFPWRIASVFGLRRLILPLRLQLPRRSDRRLVALLHLQARQARPNLESALLAPSGILTSRVSPPDKKSKLNKMAKS